MREIKFRAWEDGKMYYQVRCGGFFNGDSTAPSVYIENKGWVNMIGGEYTIIMQYTGLKDKNGKEIYEGDILKDSEGDIGVCVFRAKDNLAEYFIADPNTNFEDGWYFWDSEPIEAIGNIHENQDLL